jgi:hypothetical protein
VRRLHATVFEEQTNCIARQEADASAFVSRQLFDCAPLERRDTNADRVAESLFGHDYPPYMMAGRHKRSDKDRARLPSIDSPFSLPPKGLRRLVLEDLGVAVAAQHLPVQIGAAGWRAMQGAEAPCDMLLVLDYDTDERLQHFTIWLDEGSMSAIYVLKRGSRWSAHVRDAVFVDAHGVRAQPSIAQRRRLSLDRHKKRMALLIAKAFELDEYRPDAGSGGHRLRRLLDELWDISLPQTRGAPADTNLHDLPDDWRKWSDAKIITDVGVTRGAIAEQERRRKIDERKWRELLAAATDHTSDGTDG